MYQYKNEKPNIFQEDNVRLLLEIRDQAKKMINTSGACTMGCAVTLPSGIGGASGWTMMACIDFLVEIEELKELPTTGHGQDRVFVKGPKF